MGSWNDPGTAVNAGNRNGSSFGGFSAHTVPPAFSYIQSPEATSMAVPSNYQFAVHTPDVSLVGIVANSCHGAATE